MALILVAAGAAPLSAQALSEDFDWTATQQFPPGGWTALDGGTAPHVWGEASLSLTQSSAYMTQTVDAAAHDYSPAGTSCDSRLVSPVVDLRGYASPRLTFDSELFWVNFMAHYPGSSGDGRSTVEASADGGATWTEAWTETALLNGSSAVAVDLAPLAGRPAVRVAFRYRGSFAHAWSVDRVRLDNSGQPVGPGVTLLGSCPSNVILRATGMTPGGSVVAFAASGPGATTVVGSSCPGLVLPVANPRRLPLGTLIADANGNLQVQGAVPASACGTSWLGVVDLATCAAPPVVQL